MKVFHFFFKNLKLSQILNCKLKVKRFKHNKDINLTETITKINKLNNNLTNKLVENKIHAKKHRRVSHLKKKYK